MPLSNSEKKVQCALGTGKFLKIFTTGGPVKMFFADLKLYEQTIKELESDVVLGDLNSGVVEFKNGDNKVIKLRRATITGFERDL